METTFFFEKSYEQIIFLQNILSQKELSEMKKR